MGHPGRPRKCDSRMESLFIDVEKQRNDIVKKVLAQIGIDATDCDGRTAFIHAAAYNNIELLEWLTNNGADINFHDRIGYTALHFAAQNKYVDIATYLLDNGTNPNIHDIHGNTPLWTAIFDSMNEKRVVKLLLKHGANPNLVINIIKLRPIYLKQFIILKLQSLILLKSKDHTHLKNRAFT